MKIISSREVSFIKTYYLAFDRKNSPGLGFMFPCDEQGNPNKTEDEERIKELDNDPNFYCDVIEYDHKSITPAIGICNNCDCKVSLYSFTNTCSCGTDYNMSGQELAPS